MISHYWGKVFVTTSFMSQANIQTKLFEYLLYMAVFKEKQEMNKNMIISMKNF